MDNLNDFSLLKKGAEASLYMGEWHGKKVVIKVRIPKLYRPKALDEQIRKYRTVHEPEFIHEAKAAGVPTPLIYQVDLANATIIMEHIEGVQIKQLLNKAPKNQRKKICAIIGEYIGKLHNQGLIHGDLTTSNMILAQDKIFFVDFGLGEKNTETEAKGVDLHLLKRALQSTHFTFWEECFEDVLYGYSTVVGEELSGKVHEKIGEIERRGRYVEERKL